MDSSRGGPLTNFIMMLPLIVVPLIAILRPAERGSGLTSEDLSAAAESESLDDFGDLDFDSFDSPGSNSGFPGNSASRDDSGNPRGSLPGDQRRQPGISSDFRSQQNPAPQFPSDPHGQQRRILELEELGATRTLWFSPGESQQIGFAAFFPAGNGIVSYRFGAIADSEVAAMDEVIRQIREFQQEKAAAPSAAAPGPAAAAPSASERADINSELPWPDFSE